MFPVKLYTSWILRITYLAFPHQKVEQRLVQYLDFRDEKPELGKEMIESLCENRDPNF